MFKTRFQEFFDEIFPSDGLLGLIEKEDFITNNLALLRNEFLEPFGWEKFLHMPPRDWLYVCFRGQSNVYLIYLRVKEGKYLHFREKVRTTLSEKLDLKRTYYKIIECLTFMTLSRDEALKIVYNDGLLQINGQTRSSFFSEKLQKEEEEDKGISSEAGTDIEESHHEDL